MSDPPEVPDDLDAAISDLYAGPPGEFVAERQRLVKALRGVKRREEANEVAALARPTLVAWAANRAAVGNLDRLEALLGAGRELVEAQTTAITKGDASALRSARTARRRAVGALVDAAVAAAGDAQAGLDKHRDELNSLFEAVSVDAEAAGLLAKGRLARAPEATSGFGLLGSPDLEPATAARATPERAPAKPARATGGGRGAHRGTGTEEGEEPEVKASAADRRAAKAAVAEAERRAEAAERSREELAAALEAARAAVAEADAAVAEHEAALAAARAQREEATAAVGPAEQASAEAEAAAAAAAEVLDQARDLAAKLGL